MFHKLFTAYHKSITSIALSNKNNQFAIVETDATSNYTISVWDYVRERKLYSINLKDFPMSVGFTGGGNYIYSTSISSKPIKVFNAKSGASTTFLNKANKYIDFMYVGSSEKSALLYSSAGNIEIRDLRTSKLRKSIKTIKNLTNLTISADKAFLIGQERDKIYIY